MIGNDIVDLAQAKQDSNWRRPGFLTKIFTAHEQQLIHSANDPDRMVWLLWSMKESAYKIVVRQTGKRVFAPLKLICQLNSVKGGEVAGTVFYETIFRTKSVITDTYIASIAYLSGVSSAVRQLIVPFDSTTYSHQYQTIRTAIKQYYAVRLTIPEQAIDIEKDAAGAPSLLVDSSSGIVSVPISLSHHGHYGAYVVGDLLHAHMPS